MEKKPKIDLLKDDNHYTILGDKEAFESLARTISTLFGNKTDNIDVWFIKHKDNGYSEHIPMYDYTGKEISLKLLLDKGVK